MNKRVVLIGVFVILAAALGFSAISLLPKHQRAVPTSGPQKPEAMAQAPAQGNSSDQPSVEGPRGDKKATAPGQPAKDMKPKPDQRSKSPAGKEHQTQKPPNNVFQLVHLTRQMMRLDEGDQALKPAQAGKVLAILTPLRTKPKLTDVEAGRALKQLRQVLTAGQLKAIAGARQGGPDGARPNQATQGHRRMPPEGQRRQPPQAQGSPPPRPSGPPEGRPGFNPDAMKDFNPFYTGAKGDDRMSRMTQRIDEFFAALEKIAKSK